MYNLAMGPSQAFVAAEILDCIRRQELTQAPSEYMGSRSFILSTAPRRHRKIQNQKVARMLLKMAIYS